MLAFPRKRIYRLKEKSKEWSLLYRNSVSFYVETSCISLSLFFSLFLKLNLIPFHRTWHFNFEIYSVSTNNWNANRETANLKPFTRVSDSWTSRLDNAHFFLLAFLSSFLINSLQILILLKCKSTCIEWMQGQQCRKSEKVVSTMNEREREREKKRFHTRQIYLQEKRSNKRIYREKKTVHKTY